MFSESDVRDHGVRTDRSAATAMFVFVGDNRQTKAEPELVRPCGSELQLQRELKRSSVIQGVRNPAERG
jgi:hypothetical protein